jgi:hypothetical protein
MLGFVIGIATSLIASVIYLAFTSRAHARKLRALYGHLEGTYVNYRVKEGVETPTGGTIKIAQQSDGSLRIEGLHSSGNLEWSSIIKMSLEWENTGTGRYKYPAKPDYGTQQITVLPETGSLHVIAMNTSHGKANQFIHHWKRKDTREDSPASTPQ